MDAVRVETPRYALPPGQRVEADHRFVKEQQLGPLGDREG
jgi:hypothetical protein